MKKLVFLFFVLGLMFLESCSRGVLTFGDKSTKDIKQSQKVFESQIDIYLSVIYDLESENKVLKKLSISDTTEFSRYNQEIDQNDSLIYIYNQRIGFLDDKNNEFISRAAGKDKINQISLRGRDPYKLAEAYSIISYTQNYGKIETDGGKNALVGVVENTTWRRSVIVKVSGPGNFYREFNLRAHEMSSKFFLPSPGIYKTIFIDGYNSVTINKKVGPNIVYYDDLGKEYDFKATLTR
jgi:protein involved in ribonucleotide reduction